jgi:hypothetical protein
VISKAPNITGGAGLALRYDTVSDPSPLLTLPSRVIGSDFHGVSTLEQRGRHATDTAPM